MAARGDRSLPFGLPGTRRAAILAIVVCSLALTVAVPLRTYLSQRAEIAQQLQREQQLRQQVAQLQESQQRLSDPAQIEADARRRLRYVMPGETPYVVQLPGGDVGASARVSEAPRPVQRQAWYGRLWHSVKSGSPPTGGGA